MRGAAQQTHGACPVSLRPLLLLRENTVGSAGIRCKKVTFPCDSRLWRRDWGEAGNTGPGCKSPAIPLARVLAGEALLPPETLAAASLPLSALPAVLLFSGFVKDSASESPSNYQGLDAWML